jgi:hypothetical protein
MQKHELPSVAGSEYKTVHHGREAVPVEAALSVQKKLVTYMTPLEILPYITADMYDPVAEEVMMRYMEKYVLSGFNGFAEYCDEMANDELFMERVISDSLLESDFRAMRIFMEDRSGPLFENKAAIEEFIKKNVH